MPDKLIRPRILLAATWSAADVNDFPDSSFAWIAPGGKKDAAGKTEPRSLRSLPYKDGSGKVDLPHVRNALARLNQTQGIPAEKKSAIQTMLQNLLKKQTEGSLRGSTDIGLPTEIQLLQLGSWDTPHKGTFEITSDVVQEAISNFRKFTPEGAPINIEHAPSDPEAAAQVGPLATRAVGWIKDMIDKGEEGLWGAVEWTKEGAALVADKAYRYISPEMWWELDAHPETGEEVHNWVDAAAITNTPLFSGLRPLTASKKELTDTGGYEMFYSETKSSETNTMPTLEEVRAKDAASLTDEDRKVLQENKSELSDEEQTKFADALKADTGSEGDGTGDSGADAGASDNDEGSEGTESEGTEGAEDEGGEAADAGSEEAEKTEGSKKTVKIEASRLSQLEEGAKAGLRASAQLEHMKAVEKVDAWCFSKKNPDGKLPGKMESDVVDFYKSLNGAQKKQFSQIVDGLPKPNVFGESGSSEQASGDAAKMFETEVANMTKGNKDMSYDQASKLVARAKPDLYKEYQAELQPVKNGEQS